MTLVSPGTTRFLVAASGTTALVLVACSATVATPQGSAPACPLPLRWSILANGERRAVRVWLDVPASSRSPWVRSGAGRLQRAMDRWNALSLAVRFAPARAARDADVTVTILPRFDRDDRLETDEYRAGLTNLTFDRTGAIRRARVFIAEAAPMGVRYPLLDQEATLLHELGHVLGLPHADHPLALMAARPYAFSLTPMDVELAHSAARACGSAVAGGSPGGR